MKNTVKKILALVFVVAMVCSLAVPAFAAEFEAFDVTVIVVNDDGDKVGTAAKETVTVASAKKANVLESLKAADGAQSAYAFTIKNNVVTDVKGVVAGGVDPLDTPNAFDSEEWIVSLNGKVVNDDLSTVAVEKGDVIVVYWADAVVDTKLVMFDDSAIAKGIVSFYYYDAEGNKLPLVGANVKITGVDNKFVVESTNKEGKATAWSDTFTTDEKGQIWIAPEYLDVATTAADDNMVTYTIDTLTLDRDDDKIAEEDGYTPVEVAYFNGHLAPITVLVDGAAIEYEAGMYNTAAATGDMTMVYVLVAAAAVVTLGAVVIMKKKAVKAN